MSELLTEQIRKGISTELRSIIYFTEKGWMCSIPYGNSGRYDLLVDNGKRIYKIQCKTAHKNDNDSYSVNTSNSAIKAGGKVTKYYTKDQIDFIITFIENQAVFIPVEMIEKSRSKVFRIELPKYGSKSTCNLIQDYTFEKMFDN